MTCNYLKNVQTLATFQKNVKYIFFLMANTIQKHRSTKCENIIKVNLYFSSYGGAAIFTTSKSTVTVFLAIWFEWLWIWQNIYTCWQKHSFAVICTPSLTKIQLLHWHKFHRCTFGNLVFFFCQIYTKITNCEKHTHLLPKTQSLYFC